MIKEAPRHRLEKSKQTCWTDGRTVLVDGSGQGVEHECVVSFNFLSCLAVALLFRADVVIQRRQERFPTRPLSTLLPVTPLPLLLRCSLPRCSLPLLLLLLRLFNVICMGLKIVHLKN